MVPFPWLALVVTFRIRGQKWRRTCPQGRALGVEEQRGPKLPIPFIPALGRGPPKVAARPKIGRAHV